MRDFNLKLLHLLQRNYALRVQAQLVLPISRRKYLDWGLEKDKVKATLLTGAVKGLPKK